MSEPIADALVQLAERLAVALAMDAVSAVAQHYTDVGSGVQQVVTNVTQTDGAHGDVFAGLAGGLGGTAGSALGDGQLAALAARGTQLESVSGFAGLGTNLGDDGVPLSGPGATGVQAGPGRLAAGGIGIGDVTSFDPNGGVAGVGRGVTGADSGRPGGVGPHGVGQTRTGGQPGTGGQSRTGGQPGTGGQSRTAGQARAGGQAGGPRGSGGGLHDVDEHLGVGAQRGGGFQAPQEDESGGRRSLFGQRGAGPPSHPGGVALGNQTRSVFESAARSGRQPVFQFDEHPGEDVLDEISEFAAAFGLEPVVEIGRVGLHPG